MTADIELPPLPERFDCTNGSAKWCYGCYTMTRDDLGDYVLAEDYDALRNASEALQAKIEALRAEVDEWKDVARCASEQQDSLFREARALSARADKLRAEVERLTFEMGCLRQHYDERTACMIVHRGSALVCSDAVRAAYYEEHERAERLAKERREFAKPEMAIGLYTENRND